MVANNNKNNSSESVTDFERLNLRISGMCITDEYELLSSGEQTEVSYYNVFYGGEQDRKVLKKRTVCDTSAVIDTLNKFNFIEWNGFYGKHPEGVLDGRMFNLTATINGGKGLYASGSENFPENFYEFEQWLYETLKDCEEIG